MKAPNHTRKISLTCIKSSLTRQVLCLSPVLLFRQIVVYPTLGTNMLKIRWNFQIFFYSIEYPPNGDRKEVPSDVLIEILTKRGMARFLICSNYSTSLPTITQLMSALNSLISHYKTIGFHLTVFNCIVSPARITAHSSWWDVEVVEWQINKGQAFRFNQLLFHLKEKSMRCLK